MLNLNERTKTMSKPKPTNLRTVHTCVHITVHNCRTQYSTEQFWLFSLLTCRQPSLLRCCLLDRRGQQCRRTEGKRKQWHEYIILSWFTECRGKDTALRRCDDWTTLRTTLLT